VAVQENVRAGPAMNISQGDCRAIFDAMSDAILIHEVTTGEILEVNRGMCEMFGYTPEEARGLRVTALCGGEPGSQLEPALSLLSTAAAGSPQVFEWQARDRAGRVFWVEVNLKPIRLGGRESVLAVLRDIDRRKQAENALKELFNAGFENVTIDLIYGIPGMRLQDWAANLDFTFSFDIKHLSAYHLTFEKGTVFGKMLEKGVINEIDEEESSALFNLLIEKSEKAGFIHYEISNFGKPGYFSKHNSNYWKQVNYIGIGPSAHSFNGYSRQWNVSDVKGYINSLNTGKTFFESEELDTRDRFNEYIMTSLRTMWGIDLEYVENLSGKFKDYGLMKKEDKYLILTNQGKMISDNIIAEFMMPGDE